MKSVWYKDPEKGWVQVRMHAVDANHAVSVDPENYSFFEPSVDSAVEDGNEIKEDDGA